MLDMMIQLLWCIEITNTHWTTLNQKQGGQTRGRSLPACTTPQNTRDLSPDSWLAPIILKQFDSKTRPKFLLSNHTTLGLGKTQTLRWSTHNRFPLYSFSDKWLPSHQTIHLWSVLTLRGSFLTLNWNLSFGSFILLILDLLSTTPHQKKCTCTCLTLLSPDKSSDVGSWSLWLPWVEEAVINLQYMIH